MNLPGTESMPLRYFNIPLQVPFRGVTSRRGGVLKGPHGWGEWSPFPGYGAFSDMTAAYTSAFEPWPAAVRDSIPVHVTVPALGPEEAAAMVRASGCADAKVKVAEGDDEARVEAVRDALGPHGRLVVDANGAWEVDEAIRNIRRLYRYSVDLVEQPVRGYMAMAKVRKAVEVPLAADELASSIGAVRRIVEVGSADVLVIKLQCVGGMQSALRLREECDLPMIVSNLIETSVGVSAGVALAAALPELPFPCGLGTVPLLGGDLVVDSLVPVCGRIAVRRPEVDEDLLKRFAGTRPKDPSEALLRAEITDEG